jgi:class 3 adenylate cyclase
MTESRALREYLVELGVSDEALQRTPEEEWPALAFSHGLFPENTRLTLEDATARSGVDTAMLRRVWRAAGFVDPASDSPAFTPADVELFALIQVGTQMFGEDVMIQLVRVLGSAAQRVAEASVSAFVANVVAPSIDEDPSGLDLARANAVGAATIPGLTQAFDGLLRHHLELAQRPADGALSRGIDIQRRSIGFVDLVDSTALVQRVGTRELAAAMADFDSQAYEIVTAGGGRVVKLIGDEVMFVAPTPEIGVDIALRLADAFRDHDVLPEVRAAVATGDVLARDGDYGGLVVTLASRAAKIAQPSTVLVDRSTADALDGALVSVGPAQQERLKGFAESVPLFPVMRGVGSAGTVTT